MKIKKKALRKRLAQLPINFPAPVVERQFDLDEAKRRIEHLCCSLAHNEVEIRDDALMNVPQWIQAAFHESVSTADRTLLQQKLALGLFFCLWHSDKPLVQLECADRITKTVFSPTTLADQCDMFSAMMLILCRRWSTIDRYRLDKYLAFVRRLLFAFISRCRDAYELNGATRDECIAATLASFRDSILTPGAVGIALHVADISLDEFLKAKMKPETFIVLSQEIPLALMVKGNFVEKRVLDQFLVPIAAGVLSQRAKYLSDEDRLTIIQGLSKLCRSLSVAKSTVRLVRPMLSEAQGWLEDAAARLSAPEQFIQVSKRLSQRAIHREVAEADETRIESAALNYEARREKREARAFLVGDAKRKKPRRVLNTKRRKEYVVTKQDLYADADDD